MIKTLFYLRDGSHTKKPIIADVLASLTKYYIYTVQNARKLQQMYIWTKKVHNLSNEVSVHTEGNIA